MSFVGSLRRFPVTPTVVYVLTPIFGIAFWLFIIWRIWQRPRAWGLGVGIFLFLMIGFQTFLWRLAVTSPRPEAHTPNYDLPSFILYELPLFLSGACCILLRFRYPSEHKDTKSQCA